MSLLVPELLETTTYAFQKVRHLLEHLGIQEGVYGATDLKVVQRGAGANMSVDIGAGAAWVEGDTGTRQGLYHVVNDATVNLSVTAAHATNPRIDQVILTVFDSTVSGASDVPVLSVLAGTATSGATLDNRTGATALPNDAVRLGDILVPAASASVVTANIRDRRPWARGAFWSTLRTVDYTPSSGALVDSTNLNPRIECVGNPVRVMLAPGYSSAANGALSLFLDGVEMVPRQRRLIDAGSANLPGAFEWVVTPAAGSHTFGPGAMTAGISLGGASERGLVMVVEEVVRQNTSNG